jgi:hypothetical protein
MFPPDFYRLPTTQRDGGDIATKGGHVDKTYLLLPPALFEHPAAELSVDDSAQLGEDRRQPDHIA